MTPNTPAESVTVKTLASAVHRVVLLCILCGLKTEGAEAARELASLTGHKGLVSAVAFSPDGSRLVTGSLDTTAKVWDLKSGKELLSIPGHPGGIWYIAYSPDGRHFLEACGDGDNKGSLRDAQTGRLVRTFPPGPAGGGDWLANGPLRRTTPGHRARVEVVGFSPDGKRVLTGSEDGQVLVWNAGNGDLQLTLPPRNPTQIKIHAAAISPDGRSVAIALSGRLGFWDAKTGTELRTFIAHTNWIEALAFFPDGKRLATASYDGTARVWEVASGAELAVFRGHRGVVSCVAVSPDGRRVVTGATDATARVWDARTGEEQLVLRGHRAGVDAIAYSPDGRAVATASDDGTVRLWNVSPRAEAGSKPPATAFRLETDYVPIGIPIGTGHVRTIRLEGNLPIEGDGEADIWLDERPATLNAFGDVVERAGAAAAPLHVTLRGLTAEELYPANEVGFLRRAKTRAAHRVCELVFPGGRFGGLLQLALGTNANGSHRLLVCRPGKVDRQTMPGPLISILPLRGQPLMGSAIPDAPLRGQLRLQGFYTSADDRIQAVHVVGTPGQAVTLEFDPNILAFDAYGEPAGSTLMAGRTHQITLVDTGASDPAGTGRKLYLLQPASAANTNRIELVLSPTEVGSHRLLLHQGGEVAFIVPLHLPERRHQEILAMELGNASSAEQKAVAELRQAIGNGFSCEIRSNLVVRLSAGPGDGRLPPAGVLGEMTHLESLEWNKGTMPAPMPFDLARLRALRTLRFNVVDFSPGALASLKDLGNLESLFFSGCRGITDEAARHLGGLGELRRLSVYSEDLLLQKAVAGQRLSDAGVAQLKGLRRLEDLDLFGQDVGDASVPVLLQMPELRALALTGHGFTDAGLQGLTNLVHLRSLRLFDTGVTTNGVTRFRTGMPQVEVEVWGPDLAPQ